MLFSYNDDLFTFSITDFTEFLEQAKQNEAGTVKVKKVRKRVEKSIDGLPEQTDGIKSEKKAKKVKKKVAAATATKTILNGVESATEQKAVTENLEISSSQKTVSYRDLTAIYAV